MELRKGKYCDFVSVIYFFIFTYYQELFVYYFKALVNIDGDEPEDVQTYISPPQYGVEIRDHKWDYSIILEQ
jgi:hypothetical protein